MGKPKNGVVPFFYWVTVVYPAPSTQHHIKNKGMGGGVVYSFELCFV